MSLFLCFAENINTACLPRSAEETYGYSEAVISGWGYTEKTKVMKPRPMTSDVLREAEVFILPPEMCVKYSPFPISEKVTAVSFELMDSLISPFSDDLHIQGSPGGGDHVSGGQWGAPGGQ